MTASARTADKAETSAAVRAERALLGCILVDHGLLTRANVTTADFGSEAHRLIWTTINELAAEGVGADIVTVPARLEQEGKLQRAGGLVYVIGLGDVLPDIENVGGYARCVREAASKRRMNRWQNVG